MGREQMRVLAHPIRSRILELLCGSELSTSQLTNRIEKPPSNLYYHLDRLRESGLITITRTARVRGTVEKFYRPIAAAFSVAPELLHLSRHATERAAMLQVAQSMAERALAGFGESATRGLIGTGEGQAQPVINCIRIRTTPGRMREFQRTLEEFVRALHAEKPTAPEAMVEYTLFEMLFPTRLSPARHAKGRPRGTKRSGVKRPRRLTK